MNKNKTDMKTRNVFLILAVMPLLPLAWHAVAPMSHCWLQPEQMAACGFCAFMFGLLAGALTLES